MPSVPKPKRRPKYEDILWKLVSEFVRRLAQGRCYTCGNVKDWWRQDAGHFIDKSICGDELRFDLRNVKCQCDSCNRFHSGNKAVYAQKLVAEYGPKILDDLFAIKAIVRRWTDERYKAEIAAYRSKLKVMDSGGATLFIHVTRRS